MLDMSVIVGHDSYLQAAKIAKASGQKVAADPMAKRASKVKGGKVVKKAKK
jgi:hypothetical protein